MNEVKDSNTCHYCIYREAIGPEVGKIGINMSVFLIYILNLFTIFNVGEIKYKL